MRRRNRYNNAKKERVVMIASTVFVLAAMTMTGIYVKSKNDAEQNDGYHIDFEALEEEAENEKEGELYQAENSGMSGISSDDALDYAPPLTEADSGGVKIPGLTDGTQALPEVDHTILEDITEIENIDKIKKLEEIVEAQEADSGDQQTLADEAAMAADAENELVTEQPSDSGPALQVTDPGQQAVYSIQAGESLVWPINGTVIINYNMEGTVYFATLKQYKYNPGLVMEATEGTAITSSAAGIVTEIFNDEEIGTGVKVDIGRGYTAIYGQLKDLQVTEGSLVSAGTVLGYIGAPTKYYSVEGTNAYFALEKDGTPVNPMGALE